MADVLEIPCYEPSPERITSDIWDVIRRLENDSELRVILRPGPPDMHSAEQVAASVMALKEHGISDIAFYNYGMLRPMNLKWLQQALTKLDELS